MQVIVIAHKFHFYNSVTRKRFPTKKLGRANHVPPWVFDKMSLELKLYTFHLSKVNGAHNRSRCSSIHDISVQNNDKVLINLTKESVKVGMIVIRAGGEADTELPPEESNLKMTSEMKTCS